MPDLALPRSLDIAAVTSVAAQLLAALALGELAIDAGAVGKVDAAGLQLLCAAVVSARAAGAPVRWTAVSPALIGGARVLALSAALGLPPLMQETR